MNLFYNLFLVFCVNSISKLQYYFFKNNFQKKFSNLKSQSKMKCLLVCDNLNDVTFLKCNKRFGKHIMKLAKLQELIPPNVTANQYYFEEPKLNPDIIMQLFSPLITSQRVMKNHFSNPYRSITCYDGLTIMFDEFMGYLFVIMGHQSKYWLKRQLGVFISVVERVCGPDISMLKSSEKNFKLICAIMDSWCHLVNTEQSLLVEAIEQIRINNQTVSACIRALSEATDKLKSLLSYTQSHALIMFNHQFLSLHTTRNASELTPGDLIFLSMVGQVTEHGRFERQINKSSCLSINSDSEDSEDEEDENTERFYSPDGSKESDSVSVKSCLPADSETFSDSECSYNFLFLLSKQKPYAVHISYLAPGIPIFLIYEVGNEQLNSYILDTLSSLCSLQDLQFRGTTDRDVIHSAVDVVDNGIKKLNDSLKKKALTSALGKMHSNTVKTIVKKWEPIKKKYQDYLKSHNVESLQRIDSSIENVIFLLRGLYSGCMMDNSLTSLNHDVVLPILQKIKKSLHNFIDMFKNKASRNLALGTKSTLSINKYLEEFPGLVHFLYIDRVTHRFVAPNLDFSLPETTQLTKRKIWDMVEFARAYLQDGVTAVMWKDTIFNYSYFLWFEDASGTPLKPKTSASAIMKTLPTTGVLNENFFNLLLKKCFLASSHRVQCYELFSVHLGLITSSCVLEQCRRLTATIWEVTGAQADPSNSL